MRARVEVSRAGRKAVVAMLAALAGAAFAGAADKPRAPAPRAVSDLVVKRDGSTASGKVNSYVGDTCYLDGHPVPRATIAWIGFSTATVDLPPLADATEDEAHLRDGAVRRGHLVGVSQGEVVLESGELERADVAWLHLVAPAGAPPAPGEIRHPEIRDGGGGEEGVAAGAAVVEAVAAVAVEEAAVGRARGRPTGRQRRWCRERRRLGRARRRRRHERRPLPAPRHAAPTLPPDLPLGGELVHTWSRYHHSPPVLEGRIDQTIELRFTLLPLVQPATSPWPIELWGDYKASEIRYRVTTTGIRPVEGLETCEAPGADVHGTIVLGKMGRLGYESLPGPNGYLSVNLTTPELDLLPPDELQEASTQPVECHSASGGLGRGSIAYGSPGLALRGASCADVEPQVMCVRQTVCRHPDVPDCRRHPDRYAVLPWEGEADGLPTGPQDETISMHARWKICCGCGAGPFAPPGSASPRIPAARPPRPTASPRSIASSDAPSSPRRRRTPASTRSTCAKRASTTTTSSRRCTRACCRAR
ncbi:MAG: hypothetical protein U0X73_12805 [Thermoanaerobaculia bacterium]